MSRYYDTRMVPVNVMPTVEQIIYALDRACPARPALEVLSSEREC